MIISIRASSASASSFEAKIGACSRLQNLRKWSSRHAYHGWEDLKTSSQEEHTPKMWRKKQQIARVKSSFSPSHNHQHRHRHHNQNPSLKPKLHCKHNCRDLQNFTLNNVFVPHFSFFHKVQHTQQQLLIMLHSLSKERMDPLSEAPEVHHQP
jgi:transglutaminase/protease-like cytokinesis protein 3